MARSSTPYTASRRDALAARDARQAELDRHLAAGGTVVAVSLAIPGEEKAPPGAAALFAWAVAELARGLPGLRPLHTGDDALGPFAIFATEVDAAEAKRRCVAIEASRPAARLVDVDVYSPAGEPVDRASLGLPPRPCLCCPEPARECIALRRHGFPELVAEARRLLGC
jgi:holo-ACP synthase